MSALSLVRRKLTRLRQYGNVRGVLFFAQRRIRQAEARRNLARLVARFLPPAGSADQRFGQAATELEQHGFVMLDEVVTPTMIEDMRHHFLRCQVYAPYVLNASLVSIDDRDLPDSHILTIPERDIATCPHVLDIANHPKIIAAVEGIFGCKPTIGYMSAWWSVPTADGVPRQAENFHRDFDDINFLKLFVYLSDVEADNGPHEFIRASHSSAQLRKIRRYTDGEVVEAFGADQVVRFAGRAGTVFLENTTGLHRGLVVRSGKRLILQIVYSMLPMAYGPATPYQREIFPVPAKPIDPYINRIYVSRA